MTTPKTERLKVPLAIAAVVLALAIMMAAGIMWYQSRLQECRDLAEQRSDDRSMWEYLVETSPRPHNSPEAIAFVNHMDKRLPRLGCRGIHLYEIPPETTTP